ncbi:type III secretion system needle length determinant [uncultured Mailhella sp.]|uniref:type III secretion HpaP family protein n=1 Tax=uncultured Mailhella sp. TaxID=1981031 RepID=UPI00260CC41C|nr:type III secretion system needle length determinant [uncultured Mailhella sp.]
MDDFSIRDHTALHSAVSSASSESAMPSADRELADTFRQIMEEDRNSGSRHDLESGKTKQEAENAPFQETEEAPASQAAPMPDLLNNLFSGRMALSAAPEVQAPAPERQWETLVDRILVSAPESGSREVRISLSEQTLGGTEIALQRGADGMLSIVLNTRDPAAFQTLVAAQNDLRQLLERHEPLVRVQVLRESNREENDAQRRSRTYHTIDELEH